MTDKLKQSMHNVDKQDTGDELRNVQGVFVPDLENLREFEPSLRNTVATDTESIKHIEDVDSLMRKAAEDYKRADSKFSGLMRQTVECFGETIRTYAVMQQFRIMTQFQQETDIIIQTSDAVAKDKSM
jgi:hypothetical protein